jgi:DNA-binding response OmpR family regulator
MTLKVLLVDDELDLREGLSDLLTIEGFRCAGVGSINEYMIWSDTHDYDVLLLDRNLPDGDGLEVLKRHRATRNSPVIIISCEGQLEDRVRGLEADADYYLVKPVVVEELVALIRRFARRMHHDSRDAYALDMHRWILSFPAGLQLTLTRNEVKLMSCFIDRSGITVDRNEIIKALGSRPEVYDERRLEVMIRRLRKKVEEAGCEGFPLATVYGNGYVFNDDLIAS